MAIDGQVTAQIGKGLLVLAGVEPGDNESAAAKLLERMLHYRVFNDDRGKMNLNLMQIGGALLLVPQFTLAADTRHGLRPGFSTAAAPDLARAIFDATVRLARVQFPAVQTGTFGADMQVSLTNDGPVTFWLQG